ncbi:hypothetical protein N0M98_23835 [Paenibacillus doosanensis]|uniref:hypothetical protein n=1 Tax=Paenibacillus doosanensis TaxID=1229154 RepID=UPI00217F8370|nr:hypothetical protein [Paenibacillus doosanensis]MCS7463160.1 hypothetical protein [Paenibacillus doosanensis]
MLQAELATFIAADQTIPFLLPVAQIQLMLMLIALCRLKCQRCLATFFLHSLPVELHLLYPGHLAKNAKTLLRPHNSELIHILLIPDQIESFRVHLEFVLQLMPVFMQMIGSVSGRVARFLMPLPRLLPLANPEFLAYRVTWLLLQMKPKADKGGRIYRMVPAVVKYKLNRCSPYFVWRQVTRTQTFKFYLGRSKNGPHTECNC